MRRLRDAMLDLRAAQQVLRPGRRRPPTRADQAKRAMESRQRSARLRANVLIVDGVVGAHGELPAAPPGRVDVLPGPRTETACSVRPGDSTPSSRSRTTPVAEGVVTRLKQGNDHPLGRVGYSEVPADSPRGGRGAGAIRRRRLCAATPSGIRFQRPDYGWGFGTSARHSIGSLLVGGFDRGQTSTDSRDQRW